ncbi:ATP-binding protein [Mucilaginibacter ginsenosidivorans]|uniref:histidine kinase n=1 Tax=Mucilaginibacter ginsenosidivorans TaxID=398053 RepID=A0A5B8UX21_9SPHI|nr:ATP-binding protein [Mucilaginibacter ginsenosidivorans]QEC63458.1 PAS domain S-box protein [Mucilaginibacter ginsenosidivorans]
MDTSKSYEQLLNENQELNFKLEEANDTIEAIRTGQVDAIVVNGPNGHKVYSLKTADHTYRVFIEKMSEGAVTLDNVRTIIYSNSRFAAMVGLPLEKVIGMSFDTFIPEETYEDYKALIIEGWKDDVKQEFALENYNDGRTPCLFSCNVLELDDGVTALSLIITDLTQQKEIQRQLKSQNEKLEIARNETERMNDQLEETVKVRTVDLHNSREHFKLLANNITQMAWTNLPDGEVNFYNNRWFTYTGLGFEELKNHGRATIVHPDDLENTLQKYTSALQTGQVFEVENRYKRHDGTYRWHLNRAMPQLNGDGEIVFWIGTATDIEDQKKELEKKDEFIGVASHELKTPLTSLKGYLQLMKMQLKDNYPPVFSTYLDKANAVANKLQHLVDDLLDVSKINAGRLDYRMEVINLKDIVDDCAESSRHIYNGFTFVVDNDHDYMIRANTERLEQVITNLVNNAVKYSKTDKHIIIKTEQKGDNSVRVSVTDFGIGLDQDQKKKIFERFYRIEDKKYMTSGLGMGLYISSQIMSTHNGTMGVESEPGKGSTFYFELPLEK